MRRAAAALLMPLTGFVVLLVLVTTNCGPLRSADAHVAAVIRSVFAPFTGRTTIAKVVSEAGQPLTWQVLAVVTALALYKRQQVSSAIWAALTVLLAAPLNNLVKVIVGRERPTEVRPLTDAAGLSFPSGHAMTSMVGVIVLVTVWTAIPRKISIPVGVIVVASIGFSRLALGVHYLSDVLAGWLLGVAWVLVTQQLTRQIAGRVRRGPAPASTRPPRRRRGP